ncbi:MAG TPA: hypothetical protein VG298_02685 [Acidimicrobiales bacterium]|jgi:hypothetical protein|nr:hypothetical protein [Acidimicrobiales bacterium]
MNDLMFAVGLVVVLFTGASVLFTIVLPREPKGFQRLSTVVNRSVRLAFVGISRLARSYEAKDALLAPTAPVALIGQLAGWAACFILGYALMLEHTTHDFVSALVQASGALFTVGAINLSGPANQAVDIAAGATWAIIVALQIAYLPALYQAFNRRESLVALLESRAGVPAWGPELLARHQLVGIIDSLPDFYSAWEEWSADLAEGHTTYPVMLLFRSPDPWFSWLVGLLAVLDGAAMHLAVAPGTASSQSRLCLRMGFTALNRIAMMLGWEVDPDPNPEGPIQLTYEEFAAAVAMLEHVGFPMERSAEEAWPDFRGWRVNYETVAYRLCDRLTAPPAPWSGTRRNLRSGVVAPRRPPQRSPILQQHRPEVVIPSSGRWHTP